MEGKRVLLSKTLLFALAVLLVLNVFFFICNYSQGQGDFRDYGNIYHEIAETLTELNWDAALKSCNSWLEEADCMMMSDSTWLRKQENQLRYEAYTQLQSQYEYLLSYEGYLNKIEQDAIKLQQVSLFSNPTSFAYKNTIKTAGDFAKMRDVSLWAGHDLAVTEVFADSWVDYSVIIIIFLVCGIFNAERKEGLWSMICATPGGRQKLAVKRIGILFVSSWLAVLLLVGSRIVLCNWVFHGFGEWNRPIQSISVFQYVPTPMTQGQFWILYLAVKAFGAFWIGLVLWAVMSAISNLGLALGTMGLVVGAEYACTAIPLHSLFAAFRYVNIFSYVDYHTVFTKYYNIRFFGTLISGGYLVIIILVPLCLVFCLLSIWLAEIKRPITPTNRLLRWGARFVKDIDPWRGRGSLLLHELKKLFISRRGILLVAIMAVTLSRAAPPDREYDPLDGYKDYYQEKYAGVITQGTVDRLYAELQNATDSKQFSALSALIIDAENAPTGSWLLPTAPYDAIWSENYANYHRTTALTALLFLVLLLAPIASQERQAGMTVLLRTTSGGRKRLPLCKQVVLVITATLVWGMVYGTELKNAVQWHGAFHCLEAPAYSLSQFRELGVELSILWVMVIYYIAKLVVLIAVAECCFFLSSRCEKNRDAIILCCGMLLIPAGLAAIGSRIGEAISFLLPLGGVELFLP